MSKILDILRRPYYRARPQQLVLHVLRHMLYSESVGVREVTLPWGVRLRLNATEHIGRTIWFCGVYDLPMSESIWRLLRPGDQAVDVGANIGYMTSIMAQRVGPEGQIVAFEPNPRVLGLLHHNMDLMRAAVPGLSVEVHEAAVGRDSGQGSLVCPEGFESNQGLAYLQRGGAGGTAVHIDTLHACLAERGPVQLLKMDVEGHERDVLEGGSRLLQQHRIAHILYECHEGDESPLHALLRDFGYVVFALEHDQNGPDLVPVPRSSMPDRAATHTQNYIATCCLDELQSRFAAPGWQVLGASE